MADEHLFRFLSVRPANPVHKIDQAPTKVLLYADADASSEFRKAVQRIENSQAAPRLLRDLVAKFHGSGQFVDDLATLEIPLAAGIDWSIANAETLASDPGVPGALAAALGAGTLAELAATPQFAEVRRRVSDSIYAETLVPTAGGRLTYDRLVLARKLLALVEELAADGSPRDDGPSLTASPPPAEGARIGDLVGGRTLVVNAVRRPTDPTTTPDPPAPAVDPRPEQVEQAKTRLAQLEDAHRELSTVAVSPGALKAVGHTKSAVESRLGALEQRLTGVQQLGEQPKGGQEKAGQKIATSGAVLGPPASAARFSLSASATRQLSEQSRGVLAELKLDPDSLDPILAVGQIEREMTALGATLASLQPSHTYVMLGGVELEKDRLIDSLGIGAWLGRPAATVPASCDFAAGIGDLLMVKQKLKAYELGDFAYVENVLAGETRDREHRRLDTSEETTIDETETTTEREKDLQSTQRNETQTEADSTIKQQFGLDAGLQVSGSYGPTVQFSAHLNANYNTSSEQTQRKAVSFSQEVTQKASEKVSERIKHSVTRRVLQEIQEINRHTFTNTSNSKHIRGIYRWLSKVYDAQIFNYGQRMMYEFVVPEPAAWFLYAMVNNPPSDTEIVKPTPPTYNGAPLQPQNLTRTNYQGYVAQYQVRAVPAPPPEFQHSAYFDKQDKVDQGSDFGRGGKLDIPDGYEAFGATVMADYAFTQNDSHNYRIMIGGQSFDFSDTWGCEYQDLNLRYRELSIAYSLFHAWDFTLGVDVSCRLTNEGFAKWQQLVFDGIVEAYLKLKADYDEQKAAQQLQAGPPLGRKSVGKPAADEGRTQEARPDDADRHRRHRPGLLLQLR